MQHSLSSRPFILGCYLISLFQGNGLRSSPCAQRHLGHPSLMQHSLSGRPFILGCYLISLFQGNGLRSSPVRSDTAKHYLRAAVSWSESAQGPDVRYRTSTVASRHPIFAAPPKKNLETRRSWESLPNRREPFTPAMLESLVLATRGAHPDSRESVLCDWYAVGINAGCRRSEWAQEASRPIKLSPDGKGPLSFTRNDIQFFDANMHSLATLAVASGRLFPAFVRLRWCFQKNGDTGETKTFAVTPGHTACIVTAMIRITLRSFRLQFSDSYPLAVFSSGNQVTLVDDSHITNNLRKLAVDVYGAMSPEDLQRFPSHSLRVGACVVLHASGKNEVSLNTVYAGAATRS
jgi:hypothetical protein